MFRVVTHPPTVRSIPHTHIVRVQPNVIPPTVHKHHSSQQHQPNVPPSSFHHQPNLPPPPLHHQPNLHPPTFHQQPNLLHQTEHHQPHHIPNHPNSIESNPNPIQKLQNPQPTFQTFQTSNPTLDFQPSEADEENTQFLGSDFDLEVRNPVVRQVSSSINSFSPSTGDSRFYTESTGAGGESLVLDLVGETRGFNPPAPHEIIIITKPENENENAPDDAARFKVLEPIISLKSEPSIQSLEENFKDFDDESAQIIPEIRDEKITFSTYESQQFFPALEQELETSEQPAPPQTTVAPVAEETTPLPLDTFLPITPKQFISKPTAETIPRVSTYHTSPRPEIEQVKLDLQAMSREEFEESINQVLDEEERYVSEGYEELLEEKIEEIQRQADLLEQKYWGGKKDYEI